VKRFTEDAGLGAPPQPPAAASRIKLEGGEIQMGASNSGDDDGAPLGERVRVSPFYLQQYEVTNAEYRRFDPKHDAEAPGDHPVVSVSWYDAMAYAAWLGGTLPTEAQWELAARGPEGRTYPWGNERPSRARANYDHEGSGVGHSLGTAPVGSFPEGATPERIHDLAGNVWEWCRDGLSNAVVLKGGSYFNDESYLASAERNSHHPDGTESVVGFRVAWEIEK
jgi:formylglycine-generating enzyme required for sulfatase activity